MNMTSPLEQVKQSRDRLLGHLRAGLLLRGLTGSGACDESTRRSLPCSLICDSRQNLGASHQALPVPRRLLLKADR